MVQKGQKWRSTRNNRVIEVLDVRQEEDWVKPSAYVRDNGRKRWLSCTDDGSAIKGYRLEV